MLHIVLFEPEIPPNTGNLIRLCHNCGFTLHLIEPLGFEIDDKRMRRAGLDYIEWKDLKIHADWQAYLDSDPDANRYAISTKGHTRHSDAKFEQGDHLILGPETRGLPPEILNSMPSNHILRIPMRDGSRSLNLSNAAAILAYEAWRQLDFGGCK